MKKRADFIFECIDLSYSYNGQTAISDINLQVKKGDSLVILGANGSGKSTLLKIMDGLIFPTAGTFKAFGKIIDNKYFASEENTYNFRKKIGFIFQDPDVQLFSPTVFDEVIFAPLQLQIPQNEAIKRTNQALNLLNIGHLKDRAPFHLSGGEKKKVSIASVLSLGPEIWLMDEPTSHLDPRSISILLDFLNDLNKSGKTVIISTNDLILADEFGEMAIVLSEKHKLAEIGKKNEILKDKKLLSENNLVHEHIHKHLKTTHKHAHVHAFLHNH